MTTQAISPRRRLGRRVIMGLIALWLAFQILVPMRHHLYPGDTSWTELGHRFAWQMKLRDKRARAEFVVHDPATGQQYKVNMLRHLTPRQISKMTPRPDMILQFAHHLADLARARGIENPEVRVTVLASLNGRPYDYLIDPSVDLAAVPRDLGNADWIMPLVSEMP
ncbi:MAG: HTTM domain-containing protein [Alphaproteobacteria bacterium]|nr:HTTM domain-containing protein [Alphaproteobacteria bacterium]